LLGLLRRINLKNNNVDPIFKRNNVILIHCVTREGGAGNKYSTGKSIYERINNVINKNFELSTSTIKHGDCIYQGDRNNLFGPVGIILKNSRITFASQNDAGTWVIEKGKRLKETDNIPSEVDIEQAITMRNDNSYNELCAIDYKPIGFILCKDDNPYLIQNITSEVDFFNNTKDYNLPFYFLYQGSLKKVVFDNTTNNFTFLSNISFDDIYN